MNEVRIDKGMKKKIDNERREGGKKKIVLKVNRKEI